MDRLRRAIPNTAVAITAVLAVAWAAVGCSNTETSNVSADPFQSQDAPVVVEEPNSPQPTLLTELRPSPEALESANSTDASGSNGSPGPGITEPTPPPLALPVLTPLPTPTPVQFEQWIERQEDLPQDLTDSLRETMWAQDGLNRQEEGAISALGSLTGPDHSLSLSQWLAMPFLQTVEPADNAALRALQSVYLNDPLAYERIMNHSTISGWITDEWSPVVAALPGPRHPARGRYSIPKEFIDRLLDPDTVTVQKRDILLPLAGEVSIAIVRTEPGSDKSIDRLVHAIETAERFMGEPFPVNHVSLIFADWPDGSTVIAINNHYSLAISTVLDVGEGAPNASQADYIIAHETAHFYWKGHHDWLNEGAAELIARTASRASDKPFEPEWICEHPEADTIDELEELQVQPDQPHYSCNYAIGLRHLSDLQDTMGTMEFLDWLRSQYRTRSTAPVP